MLSNINKLCRLTSAVKRYYVNHNIIASTPLVNYALRGPGLKMDDLLSISAMRSVEQRTGNIRGGAGPQSMRRLAGISLSKYSQKQKGCNMTNQDKAEFMKGYSKPLDEIVDGYSVDSFIKQYRKSNSYPLKVKVIPTSNAFRDNYDLIRWDNV